MDVPRDPLKPFFWVPSVALDSPIGQALEYLSLMTLEFPGSGGRNLNSYESVAFPFEKIWTTLTDDIPFIKFHPLSELFECSGPFL